QYMPTCSVFRVCSAHTRYLHTFPTRRSSDQRHLVGLHQVLRLLHGLGRLALVVAKDHLDLPAEYAALGVDLLDGHLHAPPVRPRSEEHTSELQSRVDLVCRLLLEKKNLDHYH